MDELLQAMLRKQTQAREKLQSIIAPLANVQKRDSPDVWVEPSPAKRPKLQVHNNSHHIIICFVWMRNRCPVDQPDIQLINGLGWVSLQNITRYGNTLYIGIAQDVSLFYHT